MYPPPTGTTAPASYAPYPAMPYVPALYAPAPRGAWQEPLPEHPSWATFGSATSAYPAARPSYGYGGW